LLSIPAPLSEHHQLDGFRCSEPSLAQWLVRRARQNQAGGASRTYVVCEGDAVIAYYCLSAGSVAHGGAPGSIRRNMPEPIPVIVLGRLAVREDWANRGIGKGLLKDAVLRSAKIAEQLGVRALLCHAISEPAKRFYLTHGFVESPIDPMTLMLNLSGLTHPRPE
jgi:GNAT superfamily N-acetyltransferase